MNEGMKLSILRHRDHKRTDAPPIITSMETTAANDMAAHISLHDSHGSYSMIRTCMMKRLTERSSVTTQFTLPHTRAV